MTSRCPVSHTCLRSWPLSTALTVTEVEAPSFHADTTCIVTGKCRWGIPYKRRDVTRLSPGSFCSLCETLCERRHLTKTQARRSAKRYEPQSTEAFESNSAFNSFEGLWKLRIAFDFTFLVSRLVKTALENSLCF